MFVLDLSLFSAASLAGGRAMAAERRPTILVTPPVTATADRPEPEPARRRRLIVAVAAIRPGELKPGQDRGD